MSFSWPCMINLSFYLIWPLMTSMLLDLKFDLLIWTRFWAITSYVDVNNITVNNVYFHNFGSKHLSARSQIKSVNRWVIWGQLKDELRLYRNRFHFWRIFENFKSRKCSEKVLFNWNGTNYDQSYQTCLNNKPQL